MTFAKIDKSPKANATAMPVLATGIPIIETIDLNSPLEWMFWGGLVFDILFVTGFSKWIIAAGIIAARYEVQRERTA
jgi:hypothetical protein